MIPGTSFEQTCISLPQVCSMPNIKAFQPVVHEKKMFEDLTKFSLFCPLLGPKGGQPLYLNKSEFPYAKHVSYQVWLKLAMWFLRRSRLKEKADVGRTTDDAPWHKLSWPSAR